MDDLAGGVVTAMCCNATSKPKKTEKSAFCVNFVFPVGQKRGTQQN